MAGFDLDKDYYEVLCVAESASAEEIDRAFRSEARRRHPDGGGSEEEMKLLNEAHDVLSDSELRKAYDLARKPPSVSYGSSMAFDPHAASAAGTLKITVSDEDFAGLVISTAACIGCGLPLLVLIEMQWVFFLWPLRLIALGALGLGMLMGNWALAARHRQLRNANKELRASTVVIHKVIYWAAALAVISLIVAFYASKWR
ncbi:MAG TPA: DnaJ domain-containing protein [Blastocatellia bacterium]|nr:DnaJ domain-containing protein [Blastocatellia bacterium]